MTNNTRVSSLHLKLRYRQVTGHSCKTNHAKSVDYKSEVWSVECRDRLWSSPQHAVKCPLWSNYSQASPLLKMNKPGHFYTCHVICWYLICYMWDVMSFESMMCGMSVITLCMFLKSVSTLMPVEASWTVKYEVCDWKIVSMPQLCVFLSV